MSERKQASNRRNAARSTGPKSAEGKSSSSRNALRHGILGSGLLLGDEDPAEYDALFQSLVQDLRPQGALELIHVERIATAIWRQRRLIRAETAAVAFRQAANDTRKMLTETLGVPDSARIKDPSLQPLDDAELKQLVSFRELLQELDKPGMPTSTLAALKKCAPVFHEVLVGWASNAGLSLEHHVCVEANLSIDEMPAAIAHLCDLYRREWGPRLAKLEERLMVSTMRRAYHDMKAIPPEAELFARYQTSLDNSLTKAIRALREAQLARMSALESVSDLKPRA